MADYEPWSDLSGEVPRYGQIALNGHQHATPRSRPGQICHPGRAIEHLVRSRRGAHIADMAKRTSSTTGGTNVVKLATTKRKKQRAEDKFGVPVMKHGYTTLPNLLLQAQGRLAIGHAEFNVLVQLISHWWDADRDPYPAKDTIARRMGLSPRQVQRYLTNLEKAGLIRRIARFSGQKAQIANAYDLGPLVRELGAIEPEFRKAAEQRRLRQKRVEGGSA